MDTDGCIASIPLTCSSRFDRSITLSTLSAPVQVVDTDERIAAIHYHSERFDWKAEGVFKYLQARLVLVSAVFASAELEAERSGGRVQVPAGKRAVL